MKKLLILLPLICCFICNGQKDTVVYLTGIRYDTTRYDTSLVYSIRDTTPCIMLISDTSTISVNTWTNYLPVINNYMCKSNNWMKGYFTRDISWNVKYLDADKKPLSKNIIVWISKQIIK